ncbi:MAG: tetratricopeptide repeat protein [Caldilineaceae bacterium]
MTKQTSTVSLNMYITLDEANQLRLDDHLEEAINIYQSCIERFGKEVDFLAMIAHLRFKLALGNANETGENYKKAIQCLEAALELEPNNAVLHAQLAEVYTLGTLNYILAAQEYRRALEISPNNVSILFGATSLYGLPEEVVMLDEAIRWMEQATTLSPDNPHFHIRLGNLYQEAGRMLDARRAWLKSYLCSQPLGTDYAQSIRNRFEGLG